MYSDTPSIGGQLTGSEKQIEWAWNIRDSISREITRLRYLFINPALVDLCAKQRASDPGPDIIAQVKKDLAVGVDILDAAEIAISAATNARWFIDNRYSSMPALLDRKTERRLDRAHGVDIHATWENIKW